MNIAQTIDLIILEPATTIAMVESVCSKAKENAIRCVCVPPLFVKKAKECVAGSDVLVATAVGFPFGYSAIEAKLAETVLAIVDGADGIDVMANLSAIKNADWQYVAKEINTIMPVIKSRNRMIQVIIEVSELTEEEIRTCCDIYGAAGVNAIKTSTGYAQNKTTVKHVALVRKFLADAIQINAGLISSPNEVAASRNAGAGIISAPHETDIVKAALS